MNYIVYGDIMLMGLFIVNFVSYKLACKILYQHISTQKLILWCLITSFILELVYILLINQKSYIYTSLYLGVNILCMFIFVRFILKIKSIQGYITNIIGNLIGFIITAGILHIFNYRYLNLKILFTTLLIICLICPVLYKTLNNSRNTNKNTIQVKIHTQNHIIQDIAYYDSGNTLMDPYSHKPVIIMDATLLNNLITKNEYDYICKYVETGDMKDIFHIIIDNEHLYPITYRTISNDFGILPAFKIKWLQVGNHFHKNVIVGISPKSFPKNSEYKILLNKNIQA